MKFGLWAVIKSILTITCVKNIYHRYIQAKVIQDQDIAYFLIMDVKFCNDKEKENFKIQKITKFFTIYLQSISKIDSDRLYNRESRKNVKRV